MADALSKVKSFYDTLAGEISARVESATASTNPKIVTKDEKKEAIKSLTQTVLTNTIAPLLAKARQSLTRYENAIAVIGDTNP
ncbi:MAG: hypothetical protein QGH60_23435 [Phycisphaerae bacterium]|nr:hypothetical protein [Phycisphaerae bacterium]